MFLRFLPILSVVSFAAAFKLSTAAAETQAPFRTKQPTQFISRNEDKLLSIGKTSDFIGVLERPYIADPVSKNVDIYEFKKIKNLQVSQKLCSDLAISVFDDPKKSSFELKAQEIKTLQSRGKICYTALSDQSPQRSIKEKHLFIVILNLRVFGLVFRHSQQQTETQLQDELKFIDSLKSVSN